MFNNLAYALDDDFSAEFDITDDDSNIVDDEFDDIDNIDEFDDDLNSLSLYDLVDESDDLTDEELNNIEKTNKKIEYFRRGFIAFCGVSLCCLISFRLFNLVSNYQNTIDKNKTDDIVNADAIHNSVRNPDIANQNKEPELLTLVGQYVKEESNDVSLVDNYGNVTLTETTSDVIYDDSVSQFNATTNVNTECVDTISGSDDIVDVSATVNKGITFGCGDVSTTIDASDNVVKINDNGQRLISDMSEEEINEEITELQTRLSNLTAAAQGIDAAQ